MLPLFLALLLHFGPETQLTPPRLTAAPATQSAQRIATDGDGFLAIWSDTRGSTFRVYAARLDRDLEVLDPVGIQVAFGGPLGVVWTGEHYLIAYTDFGYRILVVSLDREGRLGTPHEVYSHPTQRIGSVELVTNGKTVLVALAGFVVLTDTDGNPIRTSPIDPAAPEGLDVATDGTEYMVVARGTATLPFFRVTADGTASLVSRIDAGRGRGVSLAFAGGRYVAVWASDPGELRSVSIAADGSVAHAPRTLQGAASPATFYAPRLSRRGGALVMTYILSSDSQAYALPVAADGAPAGASSAPLAMISRDLPIDSVERADGTAVALWVPLGGTLRAAIFDPFGAEPFRDARDVTRTAPEQTAVRLLNANGLLATWSEGKTRMMGRRGGAPVALPDGVSEVVAGDVIWALASDQQGIRAYRYSLDLKPLDATPIVVTGSLPQYFATVTAAAVGDRLLVGWTTDDLHGWIVRAALIDGTTVKPLLKVHDEKSFDYQPAAVWTGSEFRLFWTHSDRVGGAIGDGVGELRTFDIRALRISRGGDVLDPEPVVVLQRPAVFNNFRALRTASGTALAWIENGQVAGTMLDGTVTPWSEKPPFDLAGFDLAARPGGGLLLSWGGRNTPGEPFFAVRQIDANGVPDGDSIVLAGETGYASIAAVGADVFLGYTRRVDAPSAGGVHRIIIRGTDTGRRHAIR